jgi:hypothetical protein
MTLATASRSIAGRLKTGMIVETSAGSIAGEFTLSESIAKATIGFTTLCPRLVIRRDYFGAATSGAVRFGSESRRRAAPIARVGQSSRIHGRSINTKKTPETITIAANSTTV